LPLYHFAMRGHLTGGERPAAGKPIGLTVEIAAVGATGGQLPTAEHALREATEFSVYLEGTELEGGTTADGRFLTGRRLERYTLVPQHGGKLHVPSGARPWVQPQPRPAGNDGAADPADRRRGPAINPNRSCA